MNINPLLSRKPLPGAEPGSTGSSIDFGTFSCENVHLISDSGASGLVYEGLSSNRYGADNAAVSKLIIKECYPVGVSSFLERDGLALVFAKNTPDEEKRVFNKYRARFKTAFEAHAKLYLGSMREQTSVPASIHETNGTIYIITDASNGETLNKAYVSMDASTQIKSLIRLCEVLAEMHDSGFVYLDLKPENILVLKNADVQARQIYTGEIKLFDFDSVTSLSDLGVEKTIVSGSGDWSAFEQTHEGYQAEVGLQSDLYSIGALLFWLLIGKAPSSNEVINAYGNWDIPKNSILHPELQNTNAKTLKHIVGILNKTLTVKPSMRYSNARELIKDLSELRAVCEIKKIETQLANSDLKDDESAQVILKATIARLKVEWIEEYHGVAYKDLTKSEIDEALSALNEFSDFDDVANEVQHMVLNQLPASIRMEWIEGYWGKPYGNCTPEERDEALHMLNGFSDMGSALEDAQQSLIRQIPATIEIEWVEKYYKKDYKDVSQSERDIALQMLDKFDDHDKAFAEMQRIATNQIPASFKMEWVENYWGKPYGNCTPEERNEAQMAIDELDNFTDGVSEIGKFAEKQLCAQPKIEWIESYCEKPLRDCSKAERKEALEAIEELGGDVDQMSLRAQNIAVAQMKAQWIEALCGKGFQYCSQKEREEALAVVDELGGDFDQSSELAQKFVLTLAKLQWVESYCNKSYRDCTQNERNSAMQDLETSSDELPEVPAISTLKEMLNQEIEQYEKLSEQIPDLVKKEINEVFSSLIPDSMLSFFNR